MSNIDHIYMAKEIDELARNFLESLGVLKTRSNDELDSSTGDGRHGVFAIEYNKGVRLKDGIVDGGYIGIEIQYKGNPVYRHRGNTVDFNTAMYAPENWKKELEALIPVIKAEQSLNSKGNAARSASTRQQPPRPF